MQAKRRLIFIRKHWTGATGWSDAIGQFYARVKNDYQEAHLFEVHLGGPSKLRAQMRALETRCENSGRLDELHVIVNHSICWWALAPTLLRLKRRGANVTLHMHEHEHILGLRYCWKHLSHMHPKEWLRYSRLYHRIPARLSSNVVVLSEPQAFCIGRNDAYRENYLRVDGTLFRPRPPSAEEPQAGRRLKVLFPHDPARFDKGYRFLRAIQPALTNDVEFIMGRSIDLPYAEVYKKYWLADCIFLPSDWESYSLVAIEAMACNRIIVASPYIGAIRTLLHKYSAEALEHYGIFISIHSDTAYKSTLLNAASFAQEMHKARTRDLFMEFFEPSPPNNVH